MEWLRRVNWRGVTIGAALLPLAVLGAILFAALGVEPEIAGLLAGAWLVGTALLELALLRRSWHWAIQLVAAPVLFCTTSFLIVLVGDAFFIPPAWNTNHTVMRVTQARLARVTESLEAYPLLGAKNAKTERYGCSADSGDITQPHVERDWEFGWPPPADVEARVTSQLATSGWRRVTTTPGDWQRYRRRFGNWYADAQVGTYQGAVFVSVEVHGMRACSPNPAALD